MTESAVSDGRFDPMSRADLDVDAAWSNFAADPGSAADPEAAGDGRLSTGWRWFGVAAAAALIIGALGMLLSGDPDTLQTADEPAPTPFLTAPSTSAPNTTRATTVTAIAVATPSSAQPTATTLDEPTTTEQEPGVDARSWRTFPWEASRIEHNCLDEFSCTQVRFGPSGAAVSYDPVAHTLTRHSTPPVAVPLPEVYRDVWIETVGPFDVAYLGIRSDADELAADLVAVPTTSAEFVEVGRWQGVVDDVGDIDLVAGPDGLFNVGCCGEELVRPEPTDELVVDPTNLVAVSSVSVWEVEIKRALGRLKAPAGFAALCIERGFDPLVVGFEHAERAAQLPRHHGDPFDRLLIGQALVEDLRMVTVDRAFAAYDVRVLSALD